MGTRCVDMDPAIPDYMERNADLTPRQIDEALNKGSGLKALCGDYDMRLILRRAADGDERARLAIDMYCYRRLGHNEADEPGFTQPVMYRVIEKRVSVRESYLKRLLKLGDITSDQAHEISAARLRRLEEELSVEIPAACLPPNPPPVAGTMIRTACSLSSSASATCALTGNGVWVPVQTDSRRSPSQAATAVLVSSAAGAI